jgi:hypothetical protein
MTSDMLIATEEELKEFMVMFKAMQASNPGWTGPLTPAESVKHQKKVIENITIDQSGQFLSHWGNKQWL